MYVRRSESVGSFINKLTGVALAAGEAQIFLVDEPVTQIVEA